jgi:LmbE family N-acetylglucosaminyl deacetylase
MRVYQKTALLSKQTGSLNVRMSRKMEPPWTNSAFAVDVSSVYERKRQALAAYQSIFRMKEDRLLALYEAEDQYFGRLLGVAYAEIFRSAASLLVEDPTVFSPVSQG